MSKSLGLEYQKKSHRYIPGGAHTYSRGDDQFPSNAPMVLKRGKGARIWDVDDREFLDYGMALRAVTVGYDYDPISDAAVAEIRNGNHLPRASKVEVDAAERICNLIPGAEMVKFAKNGSTVTTAGVKLARAHTGRKLIAVCAQDPFYSYDDWFIGSTVMTRGIPEEIQNLTVKFNYNDPASLQALFDQYPNQIAVVIMQPMKLEAPQPAQLVSEGNFLHDVQHLCRKNGTVFFLDEMITGFRWKLEGAASHFGVEPDLQAFGKGMANGFSVSALTGRKEIMELGGIHHNQERVFLISTTHGSEMSSIAAFNATLDVYSEQGVVEHMWDYGRKLLRGTKEITDGLGISEYFYFEGAECSPMYNCLDRNKESSAELDTLFNQEMIEHGVFMPWVSFCLNHDDGALNQTLGAMEKSLKVYAQALESGVKGLLRGSVNKPVFRKYN